MIGAFLGLLGVFVILVTNELLWRMKLIRSELSRGFVHILVGCFIAVWPYFMSMRAIQIIAGCMLLVIALSRRYRIFQGIHGVKRRTYGEFFFPISIGLTALITSSDVIFMAAILHLSLADGLASIIGSRYGKKTTYRIFGQAKSFVGMGAFYLVSLAIMSYVGIFQIENFVYANVWVLVLLPVFATLVEGISVYGTDDLAVPLVVALILQSMYNAPQLF